MPLTQKLDLTEGKGKRKVKGKTLDLSSFLGDQNAPSGFAVVTPRRDWADYVEEENDDKYPSYKKEEKIVLPTAPKAARGPDFDVSKIPSQPPFTAFIGNLPYDITEDEIMRFFGNLKVTSVRLPRDGGDRGRMRGFGYAEFDDKQALIEALSLNGETLKNRPIKVSLAGENENDRGGDRRNDGVDRTAGDWRAAPRGDDSFSSRSQRNGTFGSKYDDSDREPYRGRSSYGDDRNLGYDGDRQPYQGRRSTERDREYGFGSDRDRTYNRKYGEGGFDSYDRERGTSSFDRGGRSDRNEENGLRRDDDKGVDHGARSERRDDNDFRRDDDRERGDRGGRGDFDSRRGAERERDGPKERTRLQLKPRSVPVEQQGMMPTPAPTATSSIFGGAKPVDTAAKEREIERRLAKEREKHDDLDKPKYSSQSGRYTDDRTPRKDYSPKRYDEPLKEKNYARGDNSGEIYKDGSSYDTEITEISYKDNSTYENPEQENGKPDAFLTNKFAHLSNQDVEE